MELHDAQKTIAVDTHRFRVVCCGRRFGKTTLAIYEMLGKAVSKKDTKIAYVSPTYQQSRDIAWAELIHLTRPVAKKINESRLEITLNTVDGGESYISLRGWESIDTLRGQRYDFIVVDEVASMRNFWLHWQEVIRPTLTDTKGEALFISTPKGFNHFYDLYNFENTDDEFKSFHFTTYDNPHIPPEEVDKARKQVTEDRFAQEYLADFRKTEGLVYKEFDREKHLVLEADFDEDEWNVVETIGGIDPGFRHHAVALTIKKTGSGRYIVSDEWSKTGKTDAEIAEYVAALKWDKAYPDPENQGFIEELQRRKVNVREVVKGKNSVVTGINVVRELFKSNKLFIVKERCPNLIWGLETYSYDEPKLNPRNDENPKKENDDEVDALRYPLMMDASDNEPEEAEQHRPQWISRRR
jgi:PBSX family phage terminase large subunit